jgi:phosphoribosyl-ATP pyrophosphohydrolase/phosphoribosyl-AMP cyclohydrolase
LRIDDPAALDALDFGKGGGLIPVVAQHARSGEVLMQAFADRAALGLTLRDRVMWYFSRSRGTYWRKGETSGSTQRVLALHGDCDADSVLALVHPAGPSCHTGARSCFGAPPLLQHLADVIDERKRTAAAGSRTARLLADENLRLKKLGEEAVELALACRAGSRGAVAEEAADLLYHLLVACSAAGVSLDDVLAALERRRFARPAQQQPVERQQDDGAEDRDPE